MFGGPSPFRNLPPLPTPAVVPAGRVRRQPAAVRPGPWPILGGGLPSGLRLSDAEPAAADGDEPLAEGPAMRRVASAAERLRGRDFAELSPAELRQLVALMREMTLAVPPRRTRRYRPARDGKRPDLRRTLRLARRSGGEAMQVRPPRAADPAAPAGRALRHLRLDGALRPRAADAALRAERRPGARGARGAGQNRPEVFSFATRLTRLTPALAAATPDTMLAKAGEAAPDWSGGTRIGAASRSSTTTTAAGAWPAARWC